MGSGNYSSQVYQYVSGTISNQSTAQVFSTRSASAAQSAKLTLDTFEFRECRDNTDHPATVPVIVAFDVTGSMGSIPDRFVREIFGHMMDILISNNVKDATVCFMAIGDHYTDSCPIQMTQFEAETTKLFDALKSIYLEGNGGGQAKESYPLAWWAAANKTQCDALIKRGQKGFLFTVGDEGFHTSYIDVKDILGAKEFSPQTAQSMFDQASKSWEIFHIHCDQGLYRSSAHPEIVNQWRTLLGERFIISSDINTIPALIGGLVASMQGADLDQITQQMSSSTALAVRGAVNQIATTNSSTGILTL